MPYSYLTALSNTDFKQIGKGRNVSWGQSLSQSSFLLPLYIPQFIPGSPNVSLFLEVWPDCLQRELVTPCNTYSKDPGSRCFPCPVDFFIILLPSRWWHGFVLLGLGQEAAGFGSSWQGTWTAKMQESEKVFHGSELMITSWKHGPLLWQWVREKGCKITNVFP